MSPTRRLAFLCIFLFPLMLAGLLSSTAHGALNPQEEAIVDYLNGSEQNRPAMVLDPVLCAAARGRAADMAARGYAGHTNPDGHNPNWVVENQFHYRLPESYPDNGNSIESFAAGRSSASATWSDWMGSSGHKSHLLAETSFFQTQTSYGVGYVNAPGSDYVHYWVVLTAPPQAQPQLAITSPAVNTATTATQIALAGTVGGLPAATAVQYRVENSAGVTAYESVSGLAKWTATVTGLAPGNNTIRVRSLGAGGAVLRELTRTVRQIVVGQLILSVSGEGTVTAGFLGTSNREIGRSYSVSAQPAKGWLFAGWSGSVNAPGRTLVFEMREGLQFTAVFIENPFTTRRGIYNGLIGAGSNDHQTTGYLKVVLAGNGMFTARVAIAGKSYPVRGRFDLDGNAVVAIPRAGLAPLQVALHLDLTSSVGEITGSVRGGSFTSTVTASRPPASGSSTFAGRYTVRMAVSGELAAGVPNGSSFALVVVDSVGRARVNGSLADGSTFAHTAFISANGSLPIYSALFGGSGSVAGAVTFRTYAGSDFGGALRWSRPARHTNPITTNAFETELSVIGSRYVAPSAAEPALQVGEGEANTALELGAGNLDAPVVEPGKLTVDHRVHFDPALSSGVKLVINPGTGRFSGTFVHPTAGKRRPIRGVILQRQNAGFGYFLGVDTSGYAELKPR